MKYILILLLLPFAASSQTYKLRRTAWSPTFTDSLYLKDGGASDSFYRKVSNVYEFAFKEKIINYLPYTQLINAPVAGTDYLSPSGDGSALTGITQSQVSGLTSALSAKAPIASPTFTGTVSGITAAMVGLGNVTNESKATMFANPTFTGTVTTAAGTLGELATANVTASGNGLKVLRANVLGTGYELATIAGTGDALTANPLSQFAATTSAQLAGVISDETGTGTLVYSTSPTLTTPNIAYTASPSTPAADNILLFNYKVGGRDMPGYVDPGGLDNALQSLFGRNGMKIWQPAGNSTTITAIGAAALTATGTATAANVATTNRHTQIRGLEYLVTVAATTAVAGWRDGVAQYYMGNSAGNGGFHFVCRFGPATGVATTTHRLFVGMSSSTAAPTDVEPSSLLNMFGVGYDAADANIQFMTNDGTGTATKTSLGIAVPTADRTAVYELAMFCAPNSTTVTYTFKDLAQGGSTVSGTVTTDLPAVNTLLAARGWMSVGGTSSVIGIALKSLYLESDY